MENVRRIGLRNMLPWTPALLTWRDRVMWVRNQPDPPPLPDLSDEALMATLDDWFLPMIAGGKIRGKAQLAKLDFSGILKSRLSWNDKQIVEVCETLITCVFAWHQQRFELSV